LNRSFGEQLWGLALDRNFGQLSGAALENSFGEPLCATDSKHTALGQLLCRGALGNNFGKQLRDITLGCNLKHFAE
jgi:hypothetical protein